MAMTVWQVWDHDPMDGSMGSDYVAATYARRRDAEADVARRNDQWRRHWIVNATDGANRLHETWNWKHARLSAVEVK